MSDKRRAILPRMRCDDDVGAEITRLRARVEVLETVREAAQALDGYGFGWLHWDEKFEALRAALREAKP